MDIDKLIGEKIREYERKRMEEVDFYYHQKIDELKMDIALLYLKRLNKKE